VKIVNNISKTIWFINCHLTENKSLEIQWGKFDECEDILDFTLEWSRKRDHAGFRWHNMILGYHFIVTVYDNRHWDYKSQEWSFYPEEMEPEEVENIVDNDKNNDQEKCVYEDVLGI
jgi:hypothetical protein